MPFSLRLAAFCFFAPAMLRAGLPFASPVCGKPVTGTVVLQVSAPPSAVRVDFSIGSHLLGASAGPRYALNWNSAEATDGESAIQAVARDLLGKEVDQGECVVRVANRNASLVVDSPDLTRALSGVVTIAVTGADTMASPAVWTLNVDGEAQSTLWTDNAFKSPNSVSFSLDTTKFTNGPHELQISMDSRSGPNHPQWVNWRAMANRVVRFANGAALMEVAPQLRSVYLKPGDRVNVGCVRRYTDGSSNACQAPSFASDAGGVAAVDAEGVITAQAIGFARITVHDGARSGEAHAWVTPQPNVPHFEGNGSMTDSYQAGKSLFVLSPFFLDPGALQGDATLAAETKKAGINTLSFGVYVNPRSAKADFGQWQQGWDHTVGTRIKWAQANNYHLLLTGDDIFRDIGKDAWYTLNWPSGKQAVQYAVGQLAASGVAIGIEGIDESSMMWGPRPNPEGRIGRAPYLFQEADCQSGLCSFEWPSGAPSHAAFALQGSTNAGLNTPAGSLYAAQNPAATSFQFRAAKPVSGAFTAANNPGLEYLWFAKNLCSGNAVCAPAVPNNALPTIKSWMQTPGVSVPVSFPPRAADSPAVFGNWMGAGSVSDYASHYFTSLKTRTTYPWGEGIEEIISSMENSFFARQPHLMLDRPQLMQISLAGPSYTKQSATAATYQPGVDILDQPGVTPEHVSATMMGAAALGAAGLRLYFFEPASNLAHRASVAVGKTLETGANPENLQVSSWRAMGYAGVVLTKALEPYLLARAENSPSYGKNVLSAVREGPEGRMLLVVNGNDWPRTVAIDLEPFQRAAGVARYRVRSAGIATDALSADAKTDRITLAPGESVVYLFPNSLANFPLARAHMTAPASGGYEYSYIYQPGLGQAEVVPCSAGCTIDRDPRLGDFFLAPLPVGGGG